MTAVSLFPAKGAWAAVPKRIDRRATVHAAYEEFHNVMLFLSGSRSFLEQLTPEEHRQFWRLGGRIIPNQTLISAPVYIQAEGRTSEQVKEKLYFSNNSEEFTIPPDQTERMAKMNGDIWFNTKMLNDPNVEFKLLDAFQLLYHEFAHTLPGEENIDLNNRIAAKIKNYLNSFYVESVVNSETTVCFLTLPFLKSEGDLLDFQPRPIVLFDIKGISVGADFDGSRLGLHANGYWSQSNRLHAFTRVNLNPKAEIYEGSLLLTWQVEYKELLRESPKGRFNHISLGDNESLTGDQEPLPPMISRKLLYHLIPWTKLTEASNQQGPHMKSMPLQIFAENPIHFSSEPSQPWVEELKLVKTVNDRFIFEGVVQSSEPIKEVHLIGQYRNNVLHFPGDVENLTTNYYKLIFSVPEGGIGGKSLLLRGVAINSKKRWDFANALSLQTRPVTSARTPKLENIYAWNGKSWISVNDMTSEALDVESDIKMRYEFSNAPVKMNHLEVSWLTHRNIRNGPKYPGYQFQTQVEIIPGSKLSQRRQGDRLIVEFSSPLSAPLMDRRDAKPPYSLEPPERASTSLLLFVDINLQTTVVGLRPIPSPWKYVFTRKTPLEKKQLLCPDLLGI